MTYPLNEKEISLSVKVAYLGDFKLDEVHQELIDLINDHLVNDYPYLSFSIESEIKPLKGENE